MGSLLGSMSEGERLLRVPELKDKDICFLANHGTLSTEMALSHTVAQYAPLQHCNASLSLTAGFVHSVCVCANRHASDQQLDRGGAV